MSQPEHFEMLVLGSGEGGKYLAWHMAKCGRRSALVERKLIGGSCPNTNCLPSKNEIWSAKVADLVHHADRFGMVTSSCLTRACAMRLSRTRQWRRASARSFRMCRRDKVRYARETWGNCSGAGAVTEKRHLQHLIERMLHHENNYRALHYGRHHLGL